MQHYVGTSDVARQTLEALEKSLNRLRLQRHLREIAYDTQQALEVYLWNCRLAAAFCFPLHIAEIVCRNAVQSTLRARLKSPWYSQPVFIDLLDVHHKRNLIDVVEREHIQHGSALTDDHIVASLTFGFWEHLATKRFDRLLWLRGIKHPFPNAYSDGLTIRDIGARLQTVRQWRNRVFHHRVLFDRKPDEKFEDVVMMIGWVCRDTAEWVWRNSDVDNLLRNPPPVLQSLDVIPS